MSVEREGEENEQEKQKGVRCEIFFMVPYPFFEKEKTLASRASLSLCAYINKNLLKQKKPTFAWVA